MKEKLEITIEGMPVIENQMENEDDNTSETLIEIESTPQEPFKYPCVGITQEREEEYSKLNVELQHRIETLSETMIALRKELKEEKELWRKEVDEFTSMQMKLNVQTLKKSTVETDKLNTSLMCRRSTINMSPSSLEFYANDHDVIDHQDKFLRCHEDCGFLKDMRRHSCRRHLANLYKKKIMELEEMCIAELAKVQMSASFLEPLKKTASTWNIPPSEPVMDRKPVTSGPRLIHEGSVRQWNKAVEPVCSSAEIPEIKLPCDTPSPKIEFDGFSLEQISSPDYEENGASFKISVSHEAMTSSPICHGDPYGQVQWFTTENFYVPIQ